jgi:hypothetical protein
MVGKTGGEWSRDVGLAIMEVGAGHANLRHFTGVRGILDCGGNKSQSCHLKIANVESIQAWSGAFVQPKAGKPLNPMILKGTCNIARQRLKDSIALDPQSNMKIVQLVTNGAVDKSTID